MAQRAFGWAGGGGGNIHAAPNKHSAPPHGRRLSAPSAGSQVISPASTEIHHTLADTGMLTGWCYDPFVRAPDSLPASPASTPSPPLNGRQESPGLKLKEFANCGPLIHPPGAGAPARAADPPPRAGDARLQAPPGPASAPPSPAEQPRTITPLPVPRGLPGPGWLHPAAAPPPPPAGYVPDVGNVQHITMLDPTEGRMPYPLTADSPEPDPDLPAMGLMPAATPPPGPVTPPPGAATPPPGLVTGAVSPPPGGRYTPTRVRTTSPALRPYDGLDLPGSRDESPVRAFTPAHSLNAFPAELEADGTASLYRGERALTPDIERRAGPSGSTGGTPLKFPQYTPAPRAPAHAGSSDRLMWDSGVGRKLSLPNLPPAATPSTPRGTTSTASYGTPPASKRGSMTSPVPPAPGRTTPKAARPIPVPVYSSGRSAAPPRQFAGVPVRVTQSPDPRLPTAQRRSHSAGHSSYGSGAKGRAGYAPGGGASNGYRYSTSVRPPQPHHAGMSYWASN